MIGMRFVDTNVLLYAVSTVPAEAAKSSVALSLLDHEDLALSVQVLQEFYVQATRPGKQHRLSHEQASCVFQCKRPPCRCCRPRWRPPRAFGSPIGTRPSLRPPWALGCRTVLSEDLNHGQNYNGVKVIDPFRK